MVTKKVCRSPGSTGEKMRQGTETLVALEQHNTGTNEITTTRIQQGTRDTQGLIREHKGQLGTIIF